MATAQETTIDVSSSFEVMDVEGKRAVNWLKQLMSSVRPHASSGTLDVSDCIKGICLVSRTDVFNWFNLKKIPPLVILDFRHRFQMKIFYFLCNNC